MKFLPFFAATVAAGPLVSRAVQGNTASSRLQNQKPIDGAQRKTIRYGPWDLPANGMETKFANLANKPCQDCFITAIEPNLLYMDGSEANVDKGAWLHHLVTFASPGPGMFWAAGNERPVLRLNDVWKAGLRFKPDTLFGVMVELMSAAPKDTKVQLELTWEYIETAKADGYKSANVHWNDIGEPPPQKGSYSFPALPWIADSPGKMLYAIGHMHDGGTSSDLYINGKLVCSSKMLYNQRNHYRVCSQGKEDLAAPNGAPMQFHISDPGLCTNFGHLKTGDLMTYTARYDSVKYGYMTHMGEKENLMGNMRVYILPDSEGTAQKSGGLELAEGMTASKAAGQVESKCVEGVPLSSMPAGQYMPPGK